MNIFYRIGAAGVAFATAMSMGTSAQAATANATATAEVLQALTLVSDGNDLDFGTMVVSGAGTVALDVTNNRTCSVNITCSGTTSVAGFNVTGSANKSVTVVLPGAATVLRHSTWTVADPTKEIELANFVTDAPLVAGPPAYNAIVLDGSGAGSFVVGGEITLDGTEIAGVYSGTFTVTADYT